MSKSLQDFSGMRFGSVTVLSRADSRNRTVWWNCICDCGTEFQASSKRIRRNSLRNCGCVKTFRGIEVPAGKMACQVNSPSYPDGRSGTDAGYQAHLKNNEEPCRECSAAHKAKCMSTYGNLTEDELRLRRDGNRSAVRRYAERHSDRVRDSSLAFRDMNRSITREAKEIPCADCGVQYPYYVMQFDHVRGHKEFNIGPIGPTVGRDRLLAEIAKCEVVCANCHAERTHSRLIGEELVGNA